MATLLEAKAKTGNAKSAKTVMTHPEHYGRAKLVKSGDYNVSKQGDVLMVPPYMTFALGKIELN